MGKFFVTVLIIKPTSNLSPYIPLINNDIPISNYAKFLGVVIDKNLTWYDHIHYISCKISKGVGILGRHKYMLPISNNNNNNNCYF